MLTYTDVVNQALIKLGAAPVNNAELDTNKPCATIRAVYDMSLDYALQHIQPVFARKRVLLDADSPTAYPVGYIVTYAYSYTLPPDYISLLRDDSDETLNRYPNSSWIIESGKLLSNTPGPLSLRYLYRQRDLSVFTGAFSYALSVLLAARASGSILQNESTTAKLEAEYQVAARAAVNINNAEIPDQVHSDTGWVLSRTSNTFIVVGV
jgi:hypothetical protein